MLACSNTNCSFPDSIVRHARLLFVRFVEVTVKRAAVVVAGGLVPVRWPRTSHRCRRLMKGRHRRWSIKRWSATSIISAPTARGQHHARMVVTVMHWWRVGWSHWSTKASVDRAGLNSSLGREGVGLLLCFDNVFLVADALVPEPIWNLFWNVKVLSRKWKHFK